MEKVKKIKIVAATGCPTGIAHTFMAEEALKKAAEKLGVDIKVETHGQVGVENQLSPEEIRDADGVIIAADKDVKAERFFGKPTIDVSVQRAIKDAESLIQAIIDGKAEKYRLKNNKADQNDHTGEISQGNSIGRSIYKHLMNGVSHMLPFVVAGGVLIAVSFTFGIKSFDPKDPTYNPFAEMLFKTGKVSFDLMIPVLAAFIADSIAKRSGMVIGFIGGMIANSGGTGFLGAIVAGFIAGYLVLLLSKLFTNLPQSLNGLKAIFLYPVIGVFLIGGIMTTLVAPMSSINETMQAFLSNFQDSNPILLGVIIGCMDAFDLGGPVNKAAYVTALALLSEGNNYFMAGIFSASMTPPLITAFASVFFRKYFNESERSAGLVNFVLGCTLITEGAIPFAAKNPIVVIPIFMVGSSISAALTYLMGVQVPAPHGGFLVAPVVTGVFQWVIAILVGSLVGAILFGIYKKISFANAEE
jgi:PTS system, fructose-specific, IIB component/PTS system, fructose subfamily, IIC component